MCAAEVSVVIPSYNHEQFIAAAIGSVLNQTFGNIEVIVIDDGSGDGSLSLVEGMATEDVRLKVFSQKNAGSHATINRGMRLASAPWVAILNSDDMWTPDRLEVMLAAAQQSGSDFLFSDTILVDGDGAAITDDAHWWNMSLARIRKRVAEHGVTEGLLYGNMTVSTSNFLFRKEILSKVGSFRNYRYNLDWDFVLRCIFAPDVLVQFVKQRLLRYRLHGKNAILNGMPLAVIEAQAITRRIYREHYGAPESLILSHHRHDRLLRRFLDGQAKRLEVSYTALETNRNQLADMLEERQSLFEAERTAMAQRARSLAADLSAMESSRDELGALLVSRQAMIENERLVFESGLTRARDLLDRRYRHQVRVALERDTSACHMARTVEFVSDYYTRVNAWKIAKSRTLSARLRDFLHPVKPHPWPDAVRQEDVASTFGQVRSVVHDSRLNGIGVPSVAAHIHLYYKELAPELLGYLLHIPELRKVVITGPWDSTALEPYLEPLRAICPDVRVGQLPNRGKDIGGLIHAIEHHELLDSDYLLKLHSKRSHNPATYFDAISALFGLRIENGDQWRKALIDPLAGSRERVMDILRWFSSDRTLGMVGAGPFVTTAPDINAELYQETCSKFGVPCGMPFVAGTMFWVRSSLLAPLLDGLRPDNFEIDSRAVEGGLEHAMERIFGALALARGFDLLRVES